MRAPESTGPGSAIALLLRDGPPSPDDRRLEEILHFLGIPWAAVSIGEARQDGVARLTAGHSMFCILAAASCLAQALQSGVAGTPPVWLAAAASVFVYGFRSTDSCRSLLRDITGDTEANIHSPDARPMTVSVADASLEMCSALSGVQIHLEPGAADAILAIRPGGGFQSIVAAPGGHLFARCARAGVAFFLDASQSIVHIHERSATRFDVRKSFAGAVPLVIYLKWSFRDICWTARETSACLIIDDPPLKPRYGFLDFRELLRLINEQSFTATIAFLPWNWRRTNSATVAAFQQNGEKLSVCVHGCDHNGGEFSTRSTSPLDRKLKTATYRMDLLRERTGLQHDRVMVFPQGAFSPETGAALKGNGFLAAVNTEIAPAGDACNETTIADLWSLAILRYGGFPIFTRRYIVDGIENFAFDGLLGKPCFIAGHHDLFRDHGGELSEFLRKLKALNWNLSWRTLADAVRHSYAIQHRHGAISAKMFSEAVVIENKQAVRQKMTVVKEEAEGSPAGSVTVNQEGVDCEKVGGHLQFAVDIPPGGTAEIRCIYPESQGPSAASEPIPYRLKVAARRYLSEVRDNYLARSDFLYRSASIGRRLLK